MKILRPISSLLMLASLWLLANDAAAQVSLTPPGAGAPAPAKTESADRAATVALLAALTPKSGEGDMAAVK